MGKTLERRAFFLCDKKTPGIKFIHNAVATFMELTFPFRINIRSNPRDILSTICE
jgi:hypothetical protein